MFNLTLCHHKNRLNLRGSLLFLGWFPGPNSGFLPNPSATLTLTPTFVQSGPAKLLICRMASQSSPQGSSEFQVSMQWRWHQKMMLQHTSRFHQQKWRFKGRTCRFSKKNMDLTLSWLNLTRSLRLRQSQVFPIPMPTLAVIADVGPFRRTRR